jgi:hypothetical protein
MTAEEWERCTSLHELNTARSTLPRSPTRKPYCYALACARLLRDEMPEACRHALDVAERYVERRVSNSDRSKARAALTGTGDFIELIAYWAACAPSDINSATRDLPFWIITAISQKRGVEASEAVEQECVRLLREIYGNPFLPAHVERAWLRWGDGAVRRIAETINDEGDFERVTVLADALEDAGCTDERILAHLRDPGPHVRGCWVVDLLLDKK